MERVSRAEFEDLYFPDKLNTARVRIYSKEDCVGIYGSGGAMGLLASLSDTTTVWYGFIKSNRLCS
jgi:hypothetical protein